MNLASNFEIEKQKSENDNHFNNKYTYNLLFAIFSVLLKYIFHTIFYMIIFHILGGIRFSK